MPAHPNSIVITSCTNRKKKLGDVARLPQDIEVQSIEALAQLWLSHVTAVKHREPVRTLYQGRAFSEAKLAADFAQAKLYVASAGHGLVSCDTLLPSYDLTVAETRGNPLSAMLDRLNKAPSDWWQAITACFESPRSLTALFESNPSKDCIVVLAMPSTYIEMLKDDFADLKDHQIARLRIITSEFGTKKLPDHIHEMALPYDERLEGNVAYAGTRSDFPQRALRHFVLEIQGHELPLGIARQRVASAMAALAKPSAPSRERKSDAAIEDLISQNWNHHNGSQSVMLRWLRDEQLISCEQARFRQIWKNVGLKK